MSAQPGEILTLGFGSVGALTAVHYWNSIASEESKRPVLFRQHSSGAAAPRFMMFDATGATQKNRKIELEIPIDRAFADFTDQEFDEAREEYNQKKKGKDGEGHEKTKEPESPPWQSYLKHKLHDRSVHSFPCTMQEISCFGAGHDYFTTHRETIEDTIRYFFEECDRAQGIQCFGEGSSLFGALAQRISVLVRDDFGHVPMFLHSGLMPRPSVPVHPMHEKGNDGFTGEEHHGGVTEIEIGNVAPEEEEHQRLVHQHHLNRLLAAVQLNDHFDAVVPFDLPNVIDRLMSNNNVMTVAQDEDTAWNIVPSLIAASVDSCWNVCRTPNSAYHFNSLRQMLRYSSATGTFSANLSFPFPSSFTDITRKPDMLARLLRYRFLTPDLPSPNSVTFSHLWSSRGVDTTDQEVYMTLANDMYNYRTGRAVFHIGSDLYPLCHQTPSSLFGVPDGTLLPPAVPVVSYLQCTSKYAVSLDAWRTAAEPLKRRTYANSFDEYGMESDEWREVFEGMHVLVDEYDRNSELQKGEEDDNFDYASE